MQPHGISPRFTVQSVHMDGVLDLGPAGHGDTASGRGDAVEGVRCRSSDDVRSWTDLTLCHRSQHTKPQHKPITTQKPRSHSNNTPHHIPRQHAGTGQLLNDYGRAVASPRGTVIEKQTLSCSCKWPRRVGVCLQLSVPGRGRVGAAVAICENVDGDTPKTDRRLALKASYSSSSSVVIALRETIGGRTGSTNRFTGNIDLRTTTRHATHTNIHTSRVHPERRERLPLHATHCADKTNKPAPGLPGYTGPTPTPPSRRVDGTTRTWPSPSTVHWTTDAPSISGGPCPLTASRPPRRIASAFPPRKRQHKGGTQCGQRSHSHVAPCPNMHTRCHRNADSDIPKCLTVVPRHGRCPAPPTARSARAAGRCRASPARAAGRGSGAGWK